MLPRQDHWGYVSTIVAGIVTVNRASGADAHKDELRRAGFDERKANCGQDTGGSNLEVCFDPAILQRNSSGFGGTSHVKRGFLVRVSLS